MSGRPKAFRLGSLRHRCTVQTVVETQDDYGQPVVTWTDLYTREPCDVIRTNGNEVVRGRQIEATTRAVITVRYRTGYTEQTSILIGTDRYQVTFIDPIDGRNRYLELHCRK